MKVLSVSPAVAGGGAEKVALAIHEGLIERGVDSTLAVANRNAEASHLVWIDRDTGRSAWAKRLLAPAWRLEAASETGRDWRALFSRALRIQAEPGRWLKVARGYEDFDFPWTGRLCGLVPYAPDILQLHNLHGGYFDIRALPDMSRQVPTVITMHDAWLLTGHCAQPLDCQRWVDGCGLCPDIGRYVPIRVDRSAENRKIKLDALRSSRAALVAPSQWLLAMAERSGLLASDRVSRVIPNAVDVAVFKPGDKAQARRELGLPSHKRIVLIVSKDVRTNPYKGFSTLSEAVGRLPDSLKADLIVLAVGDGGRQSDRGISGEDGIEVIGIPFVGDEALMAQYYRAADVLVQPSSADNFPLVLLEAMASGTPVIASDVGGIPEIVVDGRTGVVFPASESQALASALERMLRDDELSLSMAVAARQRVDSRFTFGRQVDAYLALYQELAAEMVSWRGGA